MPVLYNDIFLLTKKNIGAIVFLIKCRLWTICNIWRINHHVWESIRSNNAGLCLHTFWSLLLGSHVDSEKNVFVRSTCWVFVWVMKYTTQFYRYHKLFSDVTNFERTIRTLKIRIWFQSYIHEISDFVFHFDSVFIYMNWLLHISNCSGAS